MPQDDPAPKLHVDTDWKAEAQAEKERLAAEDAARTEAAPTSDAEGGRGVPEASFQTLVGVLASQALMGLGTMQDPETKGVVVDLEGSRFSIDLLGVIEEKTRGNLTDDETRELTQILAELRARYVQVSQLIAQQAAGGGAPPPPGAEPTA
jgi:anti-sigma factor RsiW